MKNILRLSLAIIALAAVTVLSSCVTTSTSDNQPRAHDHMRDMKGR